MDSSRAVDAALLTAETLASVLDGAELLRRMCAALPDFAPEHYGSVGAVDRTFRLDHVVEIASERWPWLEGFGWNRSEPSCEGSFIPKNAYSHSRLSIAASHITDDILKALRKYLIAEAKQLRADLGFIQPQLPGQFDPVSPPELVFSGSVPVDRFDLMFGRFATASLLKYLPQLPWATVFGPPYVRLFGKDRLLSAPVALAKEIAPDMVYVQLTTAVPVSENELSEYFDLRRGVKEHIGADAFFSPKVGKGPYRVPVFGFEASGSPRRFGFLDGKPITGLLAGRPIIETEEGSHIGKEKWKGEQKASEGGCTDSSASS